MLIIKRRRGEPVVMHLPDGRTISIMLLTLAPRSGRVRIMIDAPADIHIERRVAARAPEEETDVRTV